jgi:hypothetical protein
MCRAAPWLLAFAAALLSVPAAGASTVALEPVTYCVDSWSDCRYMDYKRGEVLRYDGEGSERNRLAVGRGGDSLLLRDAGAALRPGRGCVALDANTARCDLAALPLVGYRLDGNDGDDAIALPGSLGLTPALGQPRVLIGGVGADTLADGPDASTLLGGPGEDQLSGGHGDDRFFEVGAIVPGEPAESDDGAVSDVVDGGTGTDTVDYRSRERDLDLRLSGARPGGGEAGEHDRLNAIEVVLGGGGDDHLAGSPGPDRLEGHGGGDRLRGGAGNDELIGGPGRDDLRGGRGNDRVGTGSGGGDDGADRALCGPGRDVVGEFLRDDFLGDTWRLPDVADLVATDCESVPFGSDTGVDIDTRLDLRPHRRGRTWTFANPCVQAGQRPCRGQLSLAVLGSPAFARVPFTTTGAVRVRIGAVRSRRLARAGAVTLRVSLRETRRFGLRRSAALTLSLRPPG